MPSYNPHPERYDTSLHCSRISSTAYNGFEDLQLAAPNRVVPAARPALGSRLLSSLSTAQPAAAALTRSGSVLHSRAKSLASSFVPRLNTSAPISPHRASPPNRIFGDLFNGESAPVRLGIPPSSPSKEREETEFIIEYKPTFTERPAYGPVGRSTAQSSAATATKTGWFGRRLMIPSPAVTSTPDEILSININSSLFPNGPADPLSPHAYNDLLLNATDLLQRMQNAYKEKVDYIASIKPEIDAQREEVEESETRARHLKIQLEDMSQKAAEQNRAMQQLTEQLTREKLHVVEARAAATRTIQPVPRSHDGEDNEETPRRRKRGSAGSASDSGFESDFDRDNDSNLSSGVDTPSSPPTLTLTPTLDRGEWQAQSNTQRPSYSRGSSSDWRFNGGKRLGGEGEGLADIVALRAENHNLKRQMVDMQRTLQGCIDFVGSVPF